ncbi:MAG: ABC transporter substrate-binding protein, partial [Dehalococcoidia bacterium]
MRKSVPWLVVSCLMVAALVLASCGTADTEEEEVVGVEEVAATGPDPATTYSREVGKYGGTMRLGMAAEHSTFDPPLGAHSADLNVIDQAYEQLLVHNPDYTFQPVLATSWEPNEDLTEWTFYLRQGVKFHHGKEMTSEDVVYSFDRLFELESPGAGALGMI